MSGTVTIHDPAAMPLPPNLEAMIAKTRARDKTKLFADLTWEQKAGFAPIGQTPSGRNVFIGRTDAEAVAKIAKRANVCCEDDEILVICGKNLWLHPVWSRNFENLEGRPNLWDFANAPVGGRVVG